MRILAAGSIFVFLCTFTAAQEAPSAEFKILESIYSGKFSDSEKMLDTLSGEATPEKKLLEIFLLRWKEIPVVYSSASGAYLQMLLNLERILDAPDDRRETVYYRICAYLFLSEYYTSSGDQWLAAKAARDAYPLVMKCFDDSVSSPEYNFVKGLYLYYADYFSSYTVGGKILFPFIKKGNAASGLDLLADVAFSKSMAGTEAAIYLAHILLHHQKKSRDALAVCEKLANRYPANIKFQELLAEAFLAAGEYEKAIPVVNRLKGDPHDYYHAAGYLFEGILEEEFYKNPKKARACYSQSISSGEVYKNVSGQYIQQAEERLGGL